MKKEKLIIALIFLVIIGGAVLFLVFDYQRQREHDVTAENEGTASQQYKKITYEGESYTYNPRLDTFLYIGVDSSEGLSEQGTSGSAGQADTIVLFVMNKDTKVLTAVCLSRDTMTEIESFDFKGNSLGMIVQHLGYAYTFGDGGKVSCQNVVNAVSNLLYGIPIEEYFATDVSSIAKINEIVGGVTVTVPNNDLLEYDSAMSEGSSVTLTSENVEKFVRYRNTDVDFSNNGRLERQKAYINAYMPKLEQVLSEDLNGLWERFLEFEETTVTSITRNKYISIANNFGTMNLDEIVFYSPQGENRTGERHDEFYVDDDALFQKILEIFYIKD